MQLSFLLSGAGYTPENLDTEAKITFEDGTITQMHLTLKASVPGISSEEFLETAKKAKEICPISKLLNTEIILDAQLV